MPSQFDMEIAIKRMQDYGFNVLGHDAEGILVEIKTEMYGIVETMFEICEASGVHLKSWYFTKDKKIKLIYKYRWELDKDD